MKKRKESLGVLFRYTTESLVQVPYVDDNKGLPRFSPVGRCVSERVIQPVEVLSRLAPLQAACLCFVVPLCLRCLHDLSCAPGRSAQRTATEWACKHTNECYRAGRLTVSSGDQNLCCGSSSSCHSSAEPVNH